MFAYTSSLALSLRLPLVPYHNIKDNICLQLRSTRKLMVGLLSVTCHPGWHDGHCAHVKVEHLYFKSLSNSKSTIFLGTNYAQFHTFLHFLTGTIKKKKKWERFKRVRSVKNHENDITERQKAQQFSITEAGGNMFAELVADSYLQFKEPVIDQTIVSSPLTNILSTLGEIPKNN